MQEQEVMTSTKQNKSNIKHTINTFVAVIKLPATHGRMLLQGDLAETYINTIKMHFLEIQLCMVVGVIKLPNRLLDLLKFLYVYFKLYFN